jgi:short-subunit dehydrogenase
MMSAGGNVVVTGASAGVGRAVAIAFAREGWNVALLARSAEGLDSATREITAAGGRATYRVVDAADAAAMFAAADQIAAENGGIDVWVNNAMATMYAPVMEMTADEFKRVTEVTYLGYVYGTMAALKQMRPRNAGSIVQIGSALSYRAIPLQSAYCGGKFAVRAFTDSLRSELEHDGSAIRLTMVQLPAVNTPQFDWARNRTGRKAQPIAPIFQPEAIAQHVVRIAEKPPRELWLGWPTVKIILGNFAAPGYLDHYLARNAYQGQLTEEPRPAGKGDNLFDVPSDGHNTHGRFDDVAKDRVQAYRPMLLRAAIVAFGFAAVAVGVAIGASIR